MTGARNAFFISFNDANRRSCIFVEIREDERYEFEEQFSLRFIELEGTTLPSTLVLDPARSNITIVDNESKLGMVINSFVIPANPLYRGDCWFHQPAILCQGGRRTNDIHCGSD